MHRKSAWSLAVVSLVFFAAPPGLRSRPAAAASGDREPVLLELFTSEGCSSCPPADALLKQLDDAGRINDVEIIAIEEHVDYWNRLGWADPFSSREWSERQEHYRKALGLDSVYTPQLVVNGSRELVGSATPRALQNILQASSKTGAGLRFSLRNITAQSAEFSFKIAETPREAGAAELWLAVAERGLVSDVSRGENQGRRLSHAAVLRSLKRVAITGRDSPAGREATAQIALDPSWKRENLRFVIFLQEPRTLRILGAAALSVPR